MDTKLGFACAVVAAALAGCAASRPSTQAMGAGPGCDLRIDVASDHRCAVTRVNPEDQVMLPTNSLRVPRPPSY